MSHNLQAAPAPDFALPEHSVLSLQGRDAIAFAQSQFMNDVALLADGQWQWNGWLTPKGRVVALFALLRRDAETLWLLLPDAAPTTLAAQLQRYVFRSKVTLQARADLHVSGAFEPPATAGGADMALIGDGVELDASGDGGPRRLRVAGTPAAPVAGAVAHWRMFDLQHGLPRLGPEQAEQWTPQQLSLERLRAFSVKKGCYPGQEIVARTHFLGKAKRGLMRLEGAGVGELDEVMEGEAPVAALAVMRPIGQVICAEGGQGLAVMPIDAGDGPFSTGSQRCTPVPLLDGLAR